MQDTVAQLLILEKQQDEMEEQIKTYQAVLAKLQGENWQTHFTRKLIAIKENITALKRKLNQRESENAILKQQRDAAQKQVDELTEKLRATQRTHSTNDDQKESSKPMVCGGSMEQSVDERVRKVTQDIKSMVVDKAKSDGKQSEFIEFTPIKAKSQVVAGINWFVKIRTAKSSFIHVKVWQTLQKTYELTEIQYDRAEDDALEFSG